MDVKQLEGIFFTENHEWIKVMDNDNLAHVGITHYAVHELGDIVFVDEATEGEIEKGSVCTTIESVKSVADIYAPVTGEITSTNEAVLDEPSLVKEEPYGKGYLLTLTIQDKDSLDQLMTGQQYLDYLEQQEH